MTDRLKQLETSPRAAPSLLEEAVQTHQALEQFKAQLRESQARYRAFFETVDAGFCIIEKIEGEAGAPPDFRYVEANPAFAAQTGFSDVLGKTLRQVLKDEFEERIRIYDAVQRTGEAVRFQREFVNTGRLLELYAFRVEDQTQRRVAINFHDITERTQFRLAQARLALIVESSEDAIISMSIDGIIQTWNTGAEQMFGYQAEEIIGKPITLLIPPSLLPEEEHIRQQLRRGEAIKRYETLRLAKDGRQIDVSLTASPLKDADGSVVGSSKIIRNITEDKQIEEALHQSEARFRALLNSGAVAIYSCDCEGNILEINRAAIDLWGREPKLGETDAQFRGTFKSLRPDGSRLPYAETWMTRVLKGEIVEARDEEVSNVRPDGSRITVIVNVLPLKNEQGKITGAMLCFYDITERSRLERETKVQAQTLAELDRRKDEFLAMLGHELRNPLAALSNALQLLRLQKNEDPVRLQGLAIIERQLGHLKHLVEELLDVSRITSGSVRLRQETVNLSGIVERAIETAQPLILQHRHQLTLSQPQKFIFLHADAARLEQVLVNLLNNAAKYTDNGGRIWLSIAQEDGAVVLRVRDSGIGITPELLPHIFDLFTQAERSLDRSQGGLGIGLHLVQRLVELHDGTIEAHSVLGQGSEFVVRLPVMPPLPMALQESPTALTSPAPASAALPKKATTACRVLVVDDNVDAAQSLAKLLEMTGQETRLAYDGPSALQAAFDYHPELVLLDIGLPGLDGYEVAERIRQQVALKGVVLVALTGYGQDSDRQRSQEAGFDHHLVKPADFDEIEQIIRSIVSLRKT